MAEDFNISRSGRVRKKCSKLSDYQSAEDLPPDQLLASEDEGDSTTTNQCLESQSQILPEYNKTKIIKKPHNLPETQEPKKRKVEVTAFTMFAKQSEAALLASNPNIEPAKLSVMVGQRWERLAGQERLSWRRRAGSQEARSGRPLEVAAHLTLLSVGASVSSWTVSSAQWGPSSASLKLFRNSTGPTQTPSTR